MNQDEGLLFECFADLEMEGSVLFWIVKIKLHPLLMQLQISMLFNGNMDVSLAVAEILCCRMSPGMKVCCIENKWDFSQEMTCQNGLQLTCQVRSASL